VENGGVIVPWCWQAGPVPGRAGADGSGFFTGQTRVALYIAGMKFEDWPEEWQEWARMTPMERFRESEKIFAEYLAMGGSLDPDPDPSCPFYDPQASSSGVAYGRAGLRVIRHGPI